MTLPTTAMDTKDPKDIQDEQDDEKLRAASHRPSLSTLTNPLPDGCSFGERKTEDGSIERVIWVEFPPDSRDNPFFFSAQRKVLITIVAVVFTTMSAFSSAAFAISGASMCKELGCSTLHIEGGLALYAWGFAIFPMFLAPLSEEFGRRWTYIISVLCFCLLHLGMTLGKNTATILAMRFLLGGAASVGSTLVGGTISDIFIPAKRGLPMSIFSFCAIFGTGLGATTMVFVEVDPRLGWRWVWWIQMIILGGLIPAIYLIMRETRETVLLRRRAAKLRKERGTADGGRYIARAEITKIKFSVALRQSLLRPFIFLIREPIVTFFSLWVALGWGVFYTQIAGLPYIFSRLHNFSHIAVGQTYWSICLGAIIGLGGNFIQERIYRRKAAKHGVEARLYAPMVAGILFAAGCFVTGFTALPNVHWIGPMVGFTMVLTAIMTIYIISFVYLSECYGVYASSAIAGQSFCRNMMGGAFSFFTTAMFNTMTVRWGLVMMGGLATVLAAVPFVAFFYGPTIRAHSPYSRQLMAMEKERVQNEMAEREARGMNLNDIEDFEGDANDESVARVLSRESERSAALPI